MRFFSAALEFFGGILLTFGTAPGPEREKAKTPPLSAVERPMSARREFQGRRD